MNPYPLAELISIATDTFTKRIQDLGKTESGAYDFYESRLTSNSLVSKPEIELAELLDERFDKECVFFDIGAGVGTLGLALVSKGFQYVCVEADRRRFETALAIQDELNDHYPNIKDNFLVEQCNFGVEPLLYLPQLSGKKIGLTTNIVNSWIEDNRAVFANALMNFDELLIDPLRFGINREPEKAHEVLDLFKGATISDFSVGNQNTALSHLTALPEPRYGGVATPRPVKKLARDDVASAVNTFDATNQKSYALARQHYLDHEYDEAILILKPWLQSLRTGNDLHCDGTSLFIRSLINQKQTSPLDLFTLTKLGMTQYPEHKDFLLYHARVCRDLDLHLWSFNAYKRAFRVGAREDECQWGMIQALVHRKRFKSAAKLIDQIDLATTPFKAFPVLATEVHLALGRLDRAQQTIERAYTIKAVDSRLKKYESVLASLRAHIEKDKCGELTKRHIAIGGTSYVGSTLFGIILGGLDGVENIGESNWLIQRKDSNDSSDLIDFNTDPIQSIPLCKVHRRQGHDCIPIEFRKKLSKDPTNYYEKVADQLNTDILVTGDKSVTNYWFLDPLSRFDLVILYKHPILQMRSNIRNLNRKREVDGKEPLTEYDFNRHLHFWAQTYQSLLHNLQPKGRRLILNWEKFVNAPTPHLEIICRHLNLPFRADILENISVNHLLGGNAGVRLNDILTEKKITMRPASAAEFSAKEEAQICSHPEANYIYKVLENYYSKSFNELV